MIRRTSVRGVAALVAAASLGVAGCGGSGASGGDAGGEEGASSGEPIVIGASMPFTGPLAVFGELMKPGYELAVEQVNEAGGITVDGEKRPVELVTLDNKTDPNLAAQQTRALVTQDGAVALLGSVTATLTVPASLAAESLRVPFVTSITPVGTWLSGTKGESVYGWNFYIEEEEGARNDFKFADTVDTNKKVALFTDNAADGRVQGDLYARVAPEAGYEVAYRATFPIGTKDFQPFIEKAKASGADILIAQLSPPDGIALWKQMKALDYRPKLAACHKCASTTAWSEGLGKVAEGTLRRGYWSPTAGFPGTEVMQETLGEQFPATPDLEAAVTAYSVAQVMLDAIETAGSTDPDAINEAIGATDKTYPVGPIKFDDTNTAITPVFLMQWQGGDTLQVYPTGEGAVDPLVPVPGLR